ncbi:MAG: hypothetical protein SF097_18950 [Acidobacteriota bacterium]|nr:hypothetical protein [Acidobacteriota bacterium]
MNQQKATQKRWRRYFYLCEIIWLAVVLSLSYKTVSQIFHLRKITISAYETDSSHLFARILAVELSKLIVAIGFFFGAKTKRTGV